MSISSMSDSDYILIKASFIHHNSPDFQCRHKESLFKNRKDYDLIVKNMRKDKGCFKISDESVVEFDGIAFYSCMCHPNFQHPQYGTLTELHHNLKRGILPFSGGLLDQPNQIMEILTHMDNLYIEQENEENQKRDKKGK